MNWFEALIMGIVQGLAEYLPISSSGQLEICHQLLGLNTEGADALQFDVTLHVATVLSTIVVLWREFSKICVSVVTWKRNEEFWTFWKIIVSCIPVAIVGVCFKDVIEEFYGGKLGVVGVCLLATACLLLFDYFFRTRPISRGNHTGSSASVGHPIGWIDAFTMGIAQAIAVLPGLSRSGSTIATGILMGNKREAVAKFSFLMVIIPILGEAFLDILKAIKDGGMDSSVGVGAMVIGFISSFVVGCLACQWMINIVKKGKLVWFAAYCVAVGILCLIFG